MASHRVQKRRGLVDIPLKRGTVVRGRSSRSGAVEGRRGIIVGIAPHTNFSRAYGTEYFVCTIFPDGGNVSRRNGAQFIAVGRVKKLPVECKEALSEYERRYPSLGRKKRRK